MSGDCLSDPELNRFFELDGVGQIQSQKSHTTRNRNGYYIRDRYVTIYLVIGKQEWILHSGSVRYDLPYFIWISHVRSTIRNMTTMVLKSCGLIDEIQSCHW